MKPFFYTLVACGIVALALVPQARAQGSTTDSSSTYGQLSALTGQIAILKAQAQVAQLQQQIAAAKHSADRAGEPPTSGQAGASAYQSGGVPVPAMPAMGSAQPQVLSISGQGARLTALLQMPSGGQVEATPGTPLGGGMTVEYITPSAVQVIQNGQPVVLPFAGGGSSAPGG